MRINWMSTRLKTCLKAFQFSSSIQTVKHETYGRKFGYIDFVLWENTYECNIMSFLLFLLARAHHYCLPFFSTTTHITITTMMYPEQRWSRVLNSWALLCSSWAFPSRCSLQNGAEWEKKTNKQYHSDHITITLKRGISSEKQYSLPASLLLSKSKFVLPMTD